MKIEFGVQEYFNELKLMDAQYIVVQLSRQKSKLFIMN